MTVSASDRQLEKLRQGKAIPGNFDAEIAKPDWYDERKFLRGKKFFAENLICVFLSQLLYVLVIFSFPRIQKVLTSTEKSSCPTTALRRYASTIRVFLSWFKGDIWDPTNPAFKSLEYVMKSHKNIYRVANSNKKEEIDALQIEKQPTGRRREIFKDVRTSESSLQTAIPNTYPYLSQWDLMVVQHSLTAGVVAHPEAFGAWGTCEEDIEGYIHCWRVLGYLMGIKDEFNLCNGDLKQTKLLVAMIEEQEIVPSFGYVDYNFEHMSSAFINGISIMLPFLMYPSSLLYLLATLGADTSRLYKALTLREKMNYYFMNVVTYSCKAMFIRNFLSAMFELCLDLVEGSGPWWWPGWLTPSTTIPRSQFRVQ